MKDSNERTVTSFFRAGISGKTLTDARFSVVGASKCEVCCSGSIDNTNEDKSWLLWRFRKDPEHQVGIGSRVLG